MSGASEEAVQILCALIEKNPSAFNSNVEAPFSGTTAYRIDWEEVKKGYLEIFNSIHGRFDKNQS